MREKEGVGGGGRKERKEEERASCQPLPPSLSLPLPLSLPLSYLPACCSNYGLAAFVFTKTMAYTLRACDELEYGEVGNSIFLSLSL